jgi:hypothetical protein
MKNILMAGSLAFVFAGCAASNGGGYVVGNSAIPQGKAAKMGKSSCGCEEKSSDGKACACGSKKSGGCTSCGTDKCACSH